MPRVIFLNRFYWPDETATAQLLADLAEALAGRGYAVSVIASRPRESSVPQNEERKRVRIMRIRSTRAENPSLAAKALDFATFWLGALLRLAWDARRGDVIVALTDPPLVGIGAAVVARLRGARCIHWIQDIYPEVAVAVSGHGGLRALAPVRDAAWRRAEVCVTLGREMAGVVAAAGVPEEKIQVIANWVPAHLGAASPEEVAEVRTLWGSEGKFTVVYSGNLGRVHDLEPVLDAAEALRSDPRIVIVFAGAGALRPVLEAEAKRRGLDRVHFREPQPRGRLSAALAAGDLHLVTLRPGCEVAASSDRQADATFLPVNAAMRVLTKSRSREVAFLRSRPCLRTRR